MTTQVINAAPFNSDKVTLTKPKPSPSNNIAVFTQYIPLLGSIEEQIIDCFYSGFSLVYRP